MEKPQCSTCVFYEPQGINEGRCHRIPPQFFLAQTPHGMISVCDFPTTKSSNWCAEHAMKSAMVLDS